MLLFLLAQAAAIPCPAPVPGPAGWTVPAPVTAGTTATTAGVLTLGRGATATLAPGATVTLAAPLEKGFAPGDRGGLFAFVVPTAGRYRVALGEGVWVDVVAGGKPLASANHGHGPDCSPVRKFVEWDLQPGRYLLQVAGHAAATLRLEVAKAS